MAFCLSTSIATAVGCVGIPGGAMVCGPKLTSYEVLISLWGSLGNALGGDLGLIIFSMSVTTVSSFLVTYSIWGGWIFFYFLFLFDFSDINGGDVIVGNTFAALIRVRDSFSRNGFDCSLMRILTICKDLRFEILT